MHYGIFYMVNVGPKTLVNQRRWHLSQGEFQTLERARSYLTFFALHGRYPNVHSDEHLLRSDLPDLLQQVVRVNLERLEVGKSIQLRDHAWSIRAYKKRNHAKDRRGIRDWTDNFARQGLKETCK